MLFSPGDGVGETDGAQESDVSPTEAPIPIAEFRARSDEMVFLIRTARSTYRFLSEREALEHKGWLTLPHQTPIIRCFRGGESICFKYSQHLSAWVYVKHN